MLYYSIEDLQSALIYLNEIIDKNEKYIQAHILIAKIMYSMNDYQQTQQSIDAAMKLDINCPEIYFLKGCMSYNIGNYDNALENFKIAVSISPEDAKNYAANLVSQRSYTEKAMKEKLIARIGDEEIVEKTIAFLKEYKLIDDTDYARRYAHDLVYLKKFGIRQVKWKLHEKGISDSIIEHTLDELNFDDTISENLENLAIKKLSGNYDIKNIMKVKRYLASRGYGFDEINSVFSKIKTEVEFYEG